MTTKKLKGSSEREFIEGLLGRPLTFGDTVQALRLRDGLSQTDLAKRIGISRQYLCDVEKGRRLVSIEQAARFAKAFGHPPTVLVQLAIQDDVRASVLKLKVSVEDLAA